MNRRRILVTGGAGQVGLELGRLDWPHDVELVSPDRGELDIGSLHSVEQFISQGSCSAVINCAAWTAVDLAENHVSDAFQANCQGPANLAQVTGKMGIPFLHVSTDYVFDGESDRAYRESDPVAPLGVYGASKLAGELAVASGNPRSLILRTAWVVSAWRTNFLKTMLRIGAANRDIRVVSDQFGCPTSAADIAATLMAISLRMIDDVAAPVGIYHFVNSGEASWCDLARHIFSETAGKGGPNPTVTPITTADYPTPARRPKNSRLDTSKLTADFGIVPRPWGEAISDIIVELLLAEQAEGIAQ